MQKLFFITTFSFLLSLSWLNGQDFTLIPDPNFEQALIDLEIDSDSLVNGKVLTDDIKTVTELNIFDYNIQNLSGIEDFNSLKILSCFNNQLTSIDISNNIKLTDHFNQKKVQGWFTDLKNPGLQKKTGFSIFSPLLKIEYRTPNAKH